MPLLRVQAFVNTHDVETGSDVFADPDSARTWLVDAGVIDADVELTESELARARDVREAIRRLLERHAEDCPATGSDLAALRELAGAQRPKLTFGEAGALDVECVGHETLEDGLFELLLVIREAQQDGTWPRLKVCANDECRWAFYDRSRNQHGNWCSMASCGNRLKNRQLRARRR
jgi:predicted RNA-binding Zn ribbon-like protein